MWLESIEVVRLQKIITMGVLIIALCVGADFINQDEIQKVIVHGV